MSFVSATAGRTCARALLLYMKYIRSARHAKPAVLRAGLTQTFVCYEVPKVLPPSTHLSSIAETESNVKCQKSASNLNQSFL